MSPRVLWANRGGEARLISIEGDSITFLSAVPWPPGARVEGTAFGGASEVALRVKVHSSKRNADGEFLVQGRPLDLTRDARRTLEAMLALDLGRA